MAGPELFFATEFDCKTKLLIVKQQQQPQKNNNYTMEQR
jgi:hypothetical protein